MSGDCSGRAGGGYEWRPNTNGFFINGKAMRAENAFTPPPAQPTDKSRIVGNAEPEDGFSESSSSDRLPEEQENEIAENIFDWWISGKSYKKWYADKFSPKLDFGD